ncbi:MAG: hypothetical protein NZ455_08100 [Bacteroidia bacterium]|nr:hypothetical protein [Bacteroidia bacterium]MDW8346665.1 hypothetical protein [Bacteroidia bacterium]
MKTRIKQDKISLVQIRKNIQRLLREGYGACRKAVRSTEASA